VAAVGPEVDRASRSFEGLDLSASKAARGIRSLIAPMVSELSPALGHVGGQMASVITTAALLGSGLGAVAIAGAALAGIVGGKLLSAWQEGRAELEQFNRAMASGDLPRVTGQVETLTGKIRDLSEEIRDARKQGQGAPFITIEGVLDLLGLGPEAKLSESLDRNKLARAERERLRDVEVPGGTAAALNDILGANARTTCTSWRPRLRFTTEVPRPRTRSTASSPRSGGRPSTETRRP